MSERSRVRLATDEDLERDFPDGFVIGFPVRPSVDETQQDEQSAADDD